MSEEVKNPPTTKVELTVYDWHCLLKELEFVTCIVTRDRNKVHDLIEQVNTQLSGKEYIIQGSNKHRRLCPDDFKVKEEPPKEEEPRPLPPQTTKKKTWWQKLINE